MKYEVLWCDGQGAASRGMNSDGYVKTYITAENDTEMYKIAYLLRVSRLIRSASSKNILSIKNYLIDDWDYEEDEIKDIFEKNNYQEKDLDSINLDGIDGGDPWIISISLNGKEIYNDGYSEVEVNDDEDW